MYCTCVCLCTIDCATRNRAKHYVSFLSIQLSRPPTDTCTVCILCSLKTIIMQTLVLKVFIFIRVQTHSNWTAALHPSVNQVSDPSLSSHLENASDGETVGICICVGVCKIGGETGTGWKQGPCSIKVNTASRLLITRKMNMNEALSLLCAWTCVDHCRGLCVNTNRLSVGRLLST